MCRLLGIIANKQVDLEFSLLDADTPFRNLGTINPHGWGIGWYENNSPQIYKESGRADTSIAFPQRARAVNSKIIISHVRYGTHGKCSEQNSHPFKFGSWIFAHNGSICRERTLELLNEEFESKIQGDTDSEVHFYLLLQRIMEVGDVLSGIKQAVSEITGLGSYTGLNFLLSDGENLYAFRYARNSIDYYTLYMLERMPKNHGAFKAISEQTKQLLRSKSLNNEEAVLVCSEKLTNEDWIEIEVGALVKIESNLNVRKEQLLQ